MEKEKQSLRKHYRMDLEEDPSEKIRRPGFLLHV